MKIFLRSHTFLARAEMVLLVSLVFTLTLLVSRFSVSILRAQANSQPTLQLSISDANLAANESATLTALIKNETPNNDISALVLKARFSENQNPNKFEFGVKADSLGEITEDVALNVPSGYYLDYFHGSTKIDDVMVGDQNGVSPLAFSAGHTVNNFESGPAAQVKVTFQIKAVAARPTIFHPDIAFNKYVANTSKGENLSERRGQTSVANDEIVTVQLFIHNQILESTSHNVRVTEASPALNRSLTAKIISSEEGEEIASAQVNGTGELKLVPGSVVIKDRNGNVVKTLNETEISQLFGAGYLLNGDGILKGCWEFMRFIEYKVTLTTGGGEEGTRLTIDKKVRFNNETYDSLDRAIHLYDPGERVEFEIKVKNVGDEKATHVVVRDSLPVYLNFITCVAPTGATCDYDSASRTVTWDLGDMEVGEEKLLKLSLVVKEILPQGDRTAENIVEVSADNASRRSDNALIWINGPEIRVTNITENINVTHNENNNTNNNTQNNDQNVDVNVDQSQDQDQEQDQTATSTSGSTSYVYPQQVAGTQTVTGVTQLPVTGAADPVLGLVYRAWFWLQSRM